MKTKPKFKSPEMIYSEGYSDGMKVEQGRISELIKERIKTNTDCMKQDKYPEQIIEHQLAIEELRIIKMQIKGRGKR